MSLIRWEPFKEADDMLRGFAPLFGRWPNLLAAGGEQPAWAPAADISETDTEYVVKAELPGVKREDVKLTLEDGMLTIRGERRQEQEDKAGKKHRIERFYGSFYRSFTLPGDADAQNIRAESRDGVLDVHIPKRKSAGSTAKQIPVQ